MRNWLIHEMDVWGFASSAAQPTCLLIVKMHTQIDGGATTYASKWKEWVSYGWGVHRVVFCGLCSRNMTVENRCIWIASIIIQFNNTAAFILYTYIFRANHNIYSTLYLQAIKAIQFTAFYQQNLVHPVGVALQNIPGPLCSPSEK